MATKDSPAGLLAKVASLVRSPSANSQLHGSPDAPDDGGVGKQAIKRMIARKAHNDAVRQREFSQLRKLREATPAALSEMVARPSLYQDSSGFAASEGRQSTLKKIDEIEAQMSKQWWKGQQDKPVRTVPAEKAPPLPAPVSTSKAPELDTCDTFAPTIQTHLDESVLPMAGNVRSADDPYRSSDKFRRKDSPSVVSALDNAGISSSMMESIDMGGTLSDPVLEDAAIRFANNDNEGAESVLKIALSGDSVSQASKDIWIIALLDMYRSTGQQDSYDQLVLNSALRSGQGARRVIPGQKTADASTTANSSAQTSSAPAGFAAWRSPVVLDKPSVDQLQASLATGRTQTRLDWQALKIITPEAAEALFRATERWCDQPLTLQFESLEMLDGLLRINTPVGDRQVAPLWWLLRMNVLRVLGSREEFELVSMDYCITYEVSPPAWQSARCRCVYGLPRDSQMMHMSKDSNLPLTETEPATEALPFVDASAIRIGLFGDVQGTGAAELKQLQSALQLEGDVLVNCEGLVRVDFSAAGSILNWVASAQTTGKKIEFCCLSCLVATFFNLVGINEHARVSARVN